jgi:transcriptional regulator with XRE-family HTH domain
MSQEALAAEADLHRTYLGMVERAERNITVLSLAQIAEALGVTASSLLTEAERSRR